MAKYCNTCAKEIVYAPGTPEHIMRSTLYCSETCRQKSKRKYHKKYKPRSAARIPRVKRLCAICNGNVERSGHKYCPACMKISIAHRAKIARRIKELTSSS